MPRCSVLMCRNDSRTVNVSNGGVSYHRFPKDPNIKEQWMDATGRTNWFPKLSNTICSDHFDPKDILLTKKGYKYISDTAVPTRKIMSYHARTPVVKEKSKSKSDKVEATPGPSRKRTADSSTEASPKKHKENHSADARDYQNLTENEKKLDSMLRYEQHRIRKQAIKMERLQRKLRTLKMTITEMEDLYSVLEGKLNISAENMMSLRSTAVKVSELVARRQTNKELSEVISKLTYSPELRSFALTLHFISAKAYDYVRKTFKTSLPHPRTLKHWYLKVNGEPGFTKEAFVALKRKADASDKPILATLVIDNMDINRCVEVDGKKLYGYVDMGTDLVSDMLDEAKEVFVLSMIAINGNFKIPVAYFLACNVTSEQRAELVKLGIEMAHDADIKIVALSFANFSANVYMAKHLGCNLEKGRVTFKHPVNDEPIVAILDPSNLLKCLRDSLRDLEAFNDKDGNKIKWKYLQELGKTTFKSDELRKMCYADFQNTRVQVKLATDLFSPRVAEALQYCRKDLELEDFRQSEPTQMFLMLCNTIYDVFYSINSHVYGYKNALDKNNANQIFEFLDMACDYISRLKMLGSVSAMRCLKTSLTFVIGIKKLYASLIKTNILESLPLYKLSHDHLRLFFWNIKVDAGCKIDMDPTPKKFILAYKKIVAQIKASKGKNPPLEQITIPLSPSPVDRMNRTAGQYLIEEDKVTDDKNLEDALDLLSPNNEVAVVQISVYIVQQLMKKINCDVCVEALVTKDKAVNNFIVAIDKTHILYPSQDVVKVCKTTEMFLRGFDGKKSKQMVNSEITMLKIMRQFADTKMFDDISYHQVGEFPESNHVVDLIKAIIERYTRIHYKLRLKRETYKDVLDQLKEKWTTETQCPSQ